MQDYAILKGEVVLHEVLSVTNQPSTVDGINRKRRHHRVEHSTIRCLDIEQDVDMLNEVKCLSATANRLQTLSRL